MMRKRVLCFHYNHFSRFLLIQTYYNKEKEKGQFATIANMAEYTDNCTDFSSYVVNVLLSSNKKQYSNDLKGKFRSEMGENIFTESMVRPQNRLPMEAVDHQLWNSSKTWCHLRFGSVVNEVELA